MTGFIGLLIGIIVVAIIGRYAYRPFIESLEDYPKNTRYLIVGAVFVGVLLLIMLANYLITGSL